VIQPRAEGDLQATVEYLLDRSRSSRVALRWLRGIRARIKTLKTSPYRCPIDLDSASSGQEVRVLLYGRRQGVYRILFTIRGDCVYVLTVRHAAQHHRADEPDEDGLD
jgi:plasmid stabilization system protein ParE